MLQLTPQNAPSIQARIDSLLANGVPADSLLADSLLADSLLAAENVRVADSLQAAADSADTLGRVSREVSEAGRLLVQGEFEQVYDRFVSGFADLLVEFVPLLLSALFVFLFFYTAFRVVQRVLISFLRRSSKVDASLQSLLLRLFRIIGWTFIVIMVMAQFRIDVTALLTGLGIVGIAVGFAAKDSLENFISGVTILLDRPFVVGDMIDVEGTYGEVQEITLRSTRVKTLTNEVMVMPNLLMVNQKLVNHAKVLPLRVDIAFGIAYKEDPRQARDVALQLTEGDSRLHPDYAPTVAVTELADSSVNMTLRVFVKDARQEVPVRSDYLEAIHRAFNDADIEIPFPHLQLFVDEAKGLHDSTLFQQN
ncbi:MAG: mechanosensitive ion channel family protein [Bacteroidota bacterium]